MSNTSSQHGIYFGFYWQTHEAERAETYAEADALVSAAIKGGMKKEDAVRAAQHIFSAGWSAGSDDEAYNSHDN